MNPHQLETELRDCTDLHGLADVIEKENKSTKPEGMSDNEFFALKMKNGEIIASLFADPNKDVPPTNGDAPTVTMRTTTKDPPGSKPGGIWMKQKYRGVLTCLAFGILGLIGTCGCALDSRIVYQEPGLNGRLLDAKGNEVARNGSQLVKIPQREPNRDRNSTAQEGQSNSNSNHNTQSPTTDDFQLIVERKKRVLGCLAAIRIYHNGEKVGKLTNNGGSLVVCGKVGNEVCICGPLGDGLAFQVQRHGDLKFRVKVATNIYPCQSDNHDYDTGAFGELRYVPMKPKWQALMAFSSSTIAQHTGESPGNLIAEAVVDCRSIKRNADQRQNEMALPVKHR